MNYQEFTEIVANISYHNHKFSTEETKDDVKIICSYDAINSVSTSHMVNLKWTKFISKDHLLYMGKEDLLQTIFYFLVDSSTHEIKEFFKYKGDIVYTPHPLEQGLGLLDPPDLLEKI